VLGKRKRVTQVWRALEQQEVRAVEGVLWRAQPRARCQRLNFRPTAAELQPAKYQEQVLTLGGDDPHKMREP